MNTHAINENNRAIRIVQNIIKQYNEGFNPKSEFHSKTLAKHIVKNLKKNRLMETYNSQLVGK